MRRARLKVLGRHFREQSVTIRLASRHDRAAVARFVAGNIQARMMRPGVLLNAAILERGKEMIGAALFQDMGHRMMLQQLFCSVGQNEDELRDLVLSWLNRDQIEEDFQNNKLEEKQFQDAESMAARMLQQVADEAYALELAGTLKAARIEEAAMPTRYSEADATLEIARTLHDLWETLSQDTGVRPYEEGVGHSG